MLKGYMVREQLGTHALGHERKILDADNVMLIPITLQILIQILMHRLTF